MDILAFSLQSKYVRENEQTLGRSIGLVFARKGRLRKSARRATINHRNVEGRLSACVAGMARLVGPLSVIRQRKLRYV